MNAFSIFLLLIAPLFLPSLRQPSPQETDADRSIALFQQYQSARADRQWKEARQQLVEMLAVSPDLWMHVEIAATWSLEGRADMAFGELESVLGRMMNDPLAAGPLACNLAEELVSEDEWQTVRSDRRFPQLLERARKATWNPDVLVFDASPPTASAPGTPRPIESAERKKLRSSHALDAVIAEGVTDLDRVRRMCHWVHSRTTHSGWNRDLPEDVPGLLEAAKNGSQWRCVQFGKVLSECLNAVGIPARTVAGRARDVGTLLFGAGHVFTEAWLEDRQAWVFLDPQLDLVGVDEHGAPLNAVQFRNALARPESKLSYPRALALCMHYFLYGAFDGGSTLMLGPVGSKMPLRFQREPRPAPDHFTYRLAEAYAPPAGPQSDSTSQARNLNLEDFDFVTEKLRLNYAGWDTKVTDETRPQLDALTMRLRAQAADAAPEQLAEILKEWVDFFQDGHVGVRWIGASADSEPPSEASMIDPPTLNWSEAAVRAQLDALGGKRDPLEGIWKIQDRYRLGLLRMDGKEGQFAAVVLSTTADAWKAGQVKAEVTRTADGKLRMLYRAADHSPHRITAELMLDAAVLKTSAWGHWIREYPALPDAGIADRALPADDLFLKPLSSGTMWLRLPDFDVSRAKPLEALLEAHAKELASCPNLLIDLRDNGGGSDFVYSPIIPLLYTRPIYGVGVEIRSSEDNIALLRKEAENLRAEFPDTARWIDGRVARMQAKPGSYVPEAEEVFSIKRLDAVRPFPKRVAVLIDGAGSSGEQFILTARQSRKVTLFGKENSAGVLDFANILSTQTRSGRFRVFWATSRSLRLPQEPVDPDGIAPDIRIPAEVADPVAYAQAWLERQVD